MSTIYPDTLRIPAAGAPIEVLLIDDRDLTEEIAGTIDYLFEIKSGLADYAVTVLSKTGAGVSVPAGVLAITISAANMVGIDPGAYWGFLRITVAAQPFDLYRPFRVEVTQ